MGLGDADGQAAESIRLEGVQLLCGCRVVLDATRSIDAHGDCLDLLAQRGRVGIQKLERARLVGGSGHDLCQLGRAFSALDEVVADGRPHTQMLGQLPDRAVLGGVVARKRVDGDHWGYAVDLDVLNLLAEVGGAGEHVVGVLHEELGRQRPSRDDPVLAGVNLQRPHGGYDHRGIGSQAGGPALDVEEPFRTHVRAEACLRDQEVATVDADEIGQHGRRAVRDVPERPRVHEDRRVLQRLEQVRLDGVEHDHGHRAAGVKEVCRDRFAVPRQADHHAPETLAHVLERGRQCEHRHDLRGGGDVEARLARHAVLGRPETDDDAA